MNKKKLLAGPYLFWALAFILIPLAMIVYYGLTDANGHLTFENLLAIGTVENFKALCLSLLLSLISTAICLLLAYPLAIILSNMKVGQNGFIVLIFIIPMWMNFLLRTLAWQTLLERSHQSGVTLFPSARTSANQYALCDCSGYGLQLFTVYGSSALQRSLQN